MKGIARLFSLASASAAVAVLAWLGQPEWRYLPIASLALAVLGFVLNTLSRRLAAFFLFGSVPIFPALCLLILHRFRFTHWALWLGAALGIAWAEGARRGWVVSGWQRAVAWWSAALAMTWPIVAFREADFTLALFASFRPGTTSGGVPPSLAAAWISLAAGAQVTAILLFDWLQHHRPRETRTSAIALVSLCVGTAISCLIGVYQGSVNPGVLSVGYWTQLRRSTGGAADANVLGMAAAMTAVPALALLWGRSRAAAAVALAICIAGVWTSGSRIAFATLLLSVLVFAIRRVRARGWSPLNLRGAMLGAAGLAMLIVLLSTLRTVGPIARMRGMLPEPSLRGVQSLLVYQLWQRNLYGPISVAMIRDHPWVGAGVGGFHNQMIDYSRRMYGEIISPDNAQSWYRHQLAELGVLGSVGWIIWVCGFAWYVVLAPADAGDRLADAARAALLAFGVGSLVGVPAQDPAILVAFWALASTGTAPTAVQAQRPRVRILRIAATALLVAFVAATAFAATHGLRVPYRAVRFNFDYTYGFEAKDGYMWMTAQRAVTVPRAWHGWMKLTYRVDHRDADQRPVRVEIWRNGERVVNRRMSRGVPATTVIAVPGGKRFVLEVKVDRTFDAQGSPRGLAMNWEFLPYAPGQTQ